MGKMILDDLRKRLERLDEDADLMIDNDDRYQMVIVGGSAFILLGKLTRATHDIDALHTQSGGFGDCKALLFPRHRQGGRGERGCAELFGLEFAGTPCNR